MNIAMVGLRGIGNDISGGVERHVEELAVRMARLSHAVTVFGRSAYLPEKETEYHGVRLVRRPAIHTKHLETMSNTVACLPSVCCGYDIVHFHSVGSSLLCFAPRMLGSRVVATVHGLDFQRSKWGACGRAALYSGAWMSGRVPNETIVVSEKIRHYYNEKFNRATWFIPNGVNVPSRRGLGVLGDKFGLKEKEYILSLGRLTSEKGVHYLIPAFRRLDAPVKLVIAGNQLLGNNYLRHLRQLADGDPRIVFTGPLYGREKDEAFSNALGFVLPSELEGMPIVMLEAMSYGCPVLSSDISECAAVWETARREEGIDLCRSFRSCDVGDLTRGLREFLDDPERTAMGERAREYVLARYNWDGIVEETLDVYSRALNGKNGGKRVKTAANA